MAAVKALQQWCRLQCDGYRDVSITNMTTSFRDGLAFCAMIHRHRPDLINFDGLKKEDVYDNNKLAFQVAETELGIPALLDAEDMVALKVPDRLSILTYVSQYYNYFHGRSPIGGMGGIKRPAEAATDEPSGKKNQPVTAKVFPGPKPDREISAPRSTNITRPSSSPKQVRSFPKGPAPHDRQHHTGTLSNKCVSCDKHVHLVQRHLVDGKLYHRNCAKSLSPASSSPLRDLPTNTPVSKLTPPLDSTKNTTTTFLQAPPRLGPTWRKEEPSALSSLSNTVSSSSSPSLPASNPSCQTPSVSKPKTPRTTCENNFTTTTTTTTTTITSRPTPAPRITNPAPKVPTPTPKVPTPDPKVPTQTPKVPTPTPKVPTPTPKVPTLAPRDSTPGPRLSATASKTVQSKLKFFESDNSSEGEEKKKTTAVNVDLKTGRQAGFGVQNVTPGQTVSVVVNVSGAGKRDLSPKPFKVADRTTAVGGAERGMGLKPGDGDNVKTKASAAAFISKTLFEENSSNNNKPAWTTVALKKVDKPPQVEAPKKKEPVAVRGTGRERVKLRADPSLLADLNSFDTKAPESTSAPTSSPSPARKIFPSPTPSPRQSPRPSPAPSPASRSKLRSRSPERGSPKPDKSSPNTTASEDKSPADWRSRLKPIAQDTRPPAPPQSNKPWADRAVMSTGGSSAPPLISVSPPSQKAAGEDATGTKTVSTTVKIKPDYIPTEQILKELQDIEDSLNDLEKRGVQLEMKLRQSEEEGEDESLMDELMVEWFTLIRNKQVAIRRESELVYIGKTQDLEEQQPSVEQEIRRLMEKPDHLKTSWERQRERQLMDKLLEIVNDRNAIVDGLDEDRLREEEEDEQLNKMMMTFNVKKEKPKKWSLFPWRNKKEG